jgi:beta-lactamase class A
MMAPYPQPERLAGLEPVLCEVPGTVSVWYGRPDGPPAYTRHAEHVHYAASTMKVAVMAAAYRLADDGILDLDADVPVHDEFASAAGDGTSYRSTADYDHDPEPWDRLGSGVALRWLVRRMIVRSSNLATNLVLEQVGLASVAAAWRAAGAKHAQVGRGIQDYAAEAAGRANLVTAADLAGLMTAIGTGARPDGLPEQASAFASKSSCAEMLDVLLAQEVVDDVVRGLPPGTALAHKNGWVEGIRHSAALVFPTDAPAYVHTICVSAPLDRVAGCALLARIAAAGWADRQVLGLGGS